MANKSIDKNLQIVLDLSNRLSSIANFDEFSNILKGIFNIFFDIESLKVFLIESEKRIQEFNRDWLSLKEYDEKNYEKKICSKFRSGVNIIINGKDLEKESHIELKDRNTMYLSLNSRRNLLGFVEICFAKSLKIVKLEDSFAVILKILSNQLANILINYSLTKKMEVTNQFYQAIKNIAKIIETQYDLNYIIPIIGEMIDRFVKTHLIYLFLKDRKGQYNLVWPSACNDSNAFKMLNRLEEDSYDYKLSKDKKSIMLPIKSEGKIIGALYASDTNQKIEQEEIEYLHQLVIQSSLTIEKANEYSKMLKDATLDALTGLENRRQFEIRLNEQVSQALRKGKDLCCMMIDIDFFKRINDTFGHSAGDMVLKNVSSIIKSQLREYDIASRYGGEEFCILLPYTSMQEAKFVAKRLIETIESSSVIVEGKQIRVTISIGLSAFDNCLMGKDATQLYKTADIALYEAKNQGRNRAIVFKKDINIER